MCRVDRSYMAALESGMRGLTWLPPAARLDTSVFVDCSHIVGIGIAGR